MPEFSSGLHLQKAARQRYTIYIPHRHTQGEKVPLVLLLHWGGKKYRYIGRDAMEQFGLPALNELQAIIVAPDSKRRHWATPQSETDLTRLVAYLEEHYNIDPTRRAVVGYSGGGMGAWYLVSQRPDLFSCGAAIAAMVPEHILDSGWKFPMYLVHSKLDEVIPYEIARQRAEKLQQENAMVHFETVENATHTDIRDYIPALNRAIPWFKQIWNS